MYMRSLWFGSFTVLLLAFGAGCKKSAPAELAPNEPSQASAQSTLPQASPLDTIARVHWLGIKRLATETNADYFMSIWNLPETAKLEAQTLGKLALWLAGGAGRNVTPSNQPPGSDISNLKSQISDRQAQIQLLLSDLLHEESYLEIRSATNGPTELALAIRLDDARAFLWKTNVAALQPLAFSLQPGSNWTILGLPARTNSTVANLVAKIQKDGSPVTPPATNFWLDADLDLARVSRAFSLNWPLPSNSPKATLTVIGDGQDVRTHGELEFPRPLPLELEPWNIPTNLIHNPLVGFTAARSIRPWLKSFKPWTDLQLGADPNQVHIWAQQGIPLLEYCAFPVPNVSNFINQASDRLRQVANPWIVANRLGELARATNFHGLAWYGAPFISPQLRSAVEESGQFAVVGLMGPVLTNRDSPPELMDAVVSRTNLLYYDWEITQNRMENVLHLTQLARFLTHKAQISKDSASLLWLKAAAPKLGNCITLLNELDSRHLSLVRRSSFGLNSLELNILSDWLDSPQFPIGLHTFRSPPPVQPLLQFTNPPVGPH
jgi:hypothetical protein